MSKAQFEGLISGERRLSRAELGARVLRAARGFDELGVGEGDCVALLLRNDFAFFEASLAAMRLGAYAVPINWHFKADEVGYILRDCAARVLVVHADLLLGIAGAIPAGTACLVVQTPPEVCAAYRIDPALARLQANATDWDRWVASHTPHEGAMRRPTYSMIYTSGTTGNPKGVRRHAPSPDDERKTEDLRRAVYGSREGMIAALPGPLYHSAPNSFGLRAVRDASCTILVPRFDAEELLAIIERHRVTHMFMGPTMFVRLLKLPEQVRRRYDVSSLEFIIHAAAPCPADVKRAMIEWWGPTLNEFYGGTESGPVTLSSSADFLAHPGTVGRVVPGAIVRALDEDGNEVPAGTPGELFMRIPYYPDFTYHNQPEKRREVERDGLMTIGDVGYFDAEGYLYICDRKRDMVISGGVNIYPAEIEAAILALDGVKDCAVFGIPDAEFGETLMAIVEPQDGAVIAPDDVRAYLQAQLADYKVPRRIEIGRDLPREDSGKIFKRRLREPYWREAGRAI
ncbi:MAG: AMP-binding protein [Methylobacteriaceae bacterium]|nr:AMP-binding protein [Methylobacteriaceae bacterium]